LGPNKVQNKENVNKNLLLMNHWPDIDIWHGTSLGQFDFVQLSPWGHKWPWPKGTLFYIGLYSKNI